MILDRKNFDDLLARVFKDDSEQTVTDLENLRDTFDGLGNIEQISKERDRYKEKYINGLKKGFSAEDYEKEFNQPPFGNKEKENKEKENPYEGKSDREILDSLFAKKGE